MSRTSDLEFFLPGDATDEIYVLNRDEKARDDVRASLNRMWCRCREFCGDRNFREKAKQDFEAQAWHLYLLDSLLNLGHNILPAAAEGPDINLRLNEQTIWIEAICMKPGSGTNEAVCPEDLQPHTPSDEKIILRHTAGLKEKNSQHEKYLKRGIVKLEDPYIVALNVGLVYLANLWAGRLVSYLEMSTLGLGRQQFHIAIPSGEHVGTSYEDQPIVQKPSNGADVSTLGFVNSVNSDCFRNISAVIYSTHHFANYHDKEGKDLILLHNPSATNRIPLNVLKIAHEKWVDENGELRKGC